MFSALSACSGPERDLPPEYRSIPVPAAKLASADARARGRALYLVDCSLCHGANADGRGLRSRYLGDRAADFTDPAWRARVTPRTVFHAIREGVHGTPMPAWKTALSPEETWDLVAYVLSVERRRDGRGGTP